MTSPPRDKRVSKTVAEADCYIAWAEKDRAQTKLLNVQRKIEELALKEAQREEKYNAAWPDQQRVYTFYGEVEPEAIQKCIEELGIWSRRDPKQPITIQLNSCGGYCIDGIALYDYIQQLRKIGHYFTIIAIGEASSMGGIILQAADWRVMGATSELLIHEVAAEQYGSKTVSWIHDRHAYLLKLQRRMDEILAERSTMTAMEIEEKAKKLDWFLDANEALELGFIDEIR